jgi:hypothetical protein
VKKSRPGGSGSDVGTARQCALALKDNNAFCLLFCVTKKSQTSLKKKSREQYARTSHYMICLVLRRSHRRAQPGGAGGIEVQEPGDSHLLASCSVSYSHWHERFM